MYFSFYSSLEISHIYFESDVGTIGDEVIIRTNSDDCHNNKLISIGINEPYSRLNADIKKREVTEQQQSTSSLSSTVIIKHQESQILIAAYVFAKTCMVLIYSIDGSHRVCLWDVSTRNNITLRRDTTSNQIRIPMDASIGQVWSTDDSNTIFIGYETLGMPYTILKGIYDPLRMDFRFVKVFKPIVNGISTKDYVTERVRL